MLSLLHFYFNLTKYVLYSENGNCDNTQKKNVSQNLPIKTFVE